MSDSDDDIGPGCRYYSSWRYMMSPEFTSFFGLDPRYRYSERQLDRVITDYAKSHNGIVQHKIVYNKALWKLFKLPISTPFKIGRHIHTLRIQNRPCPICEKPRPFYSYHPNRVCDECSGAAPPYIVPHQEGTLVEHVQKSTNGRNQTILSCAGSHVDTHIIIALILSPLFIVPFVKPKSTKNVISAHFVVDARGPKSWWIRTGIAFDSNPRDITIIKTGLPFFIMKMERL